MKPLRFVIINPTSPFWRVRNGERPHQSRYFRFSMLPSLYVAASMPPYVETRIVDEELHAVDLDVEADIIGLSFMTYNAPRAYEIADAFRNGRGRPVIAGGYHPTFKPEEALQHADAVCVGDAEDVVPRMMRDFQAGTLAGIYRSESPCLGGLPVPDRSLLRRSAYAPIDAVQATRGCRQRCRFCSVTAFHHARHRARPVAEVVDELRGLRKHVLFMDDNLIGDRDYALELFAAMLPLGKRWFSQCGIGIAQDEELLALAARSGCRGLFIGFETLSQQGLRIWGKHGNLGKDYLAAVGKLHAAGIAVCAAFVFGGDDDTPDVFERTLDFLLDANIEVLQATRMTPFPGTPLHEDLDRQGRIFDRDWSHYDFNHVVFEPKHMHPGVLDNGVAWVGTRFLERRRVALRLWRSFQYLDPSVVLGGVLPLNLGYRHRKAVDGDFRRGSVFEPPGAASVRSPDACRDRFR
jgi:radical SAM superfamily enzyme YgiQ (UPF0313 family)